MVVGVPSPVTIVEEGDIHVCELSTSVVESTSILSNVTELPIDQTTNIIEYPFELLSGEELIYHGADLTDGCIYLTAYRLFIISNQSSSHCSFINCPVGLIESVEIKDNIHLYIQCKDIRSFRVMFMTTEKCNYWLRKLNESLLTLLTSNDLFSIKYALAKSQQDNDIKIDCIRQEFVRLRLDQPPWRITEINTDYKFSPSYPNICIVPASITDDEVREVAKFRSHKRFPTIVWRHTNGAIIARTSQPEVGWLFWRSKEDEKMIQAIINACKPTETQVSTTSNENNANRLLILDARSYAAALANRAKGGGFEHPPYYLDCDVQFMNLPNIHAIRKSAQMLRVAVTNVAQGETWLSQIESSRWLHNLSALISAASFVVDTVHNQARPVLIHCSDGWDRTPQITTLAEIMLDPYYRTIEGFQALIQREWIAFGHKFADRCGHWNGSNDLNERSPVFLQWLDCIYQLYTQHPTAFEFNENFLLKLANHTYTCLYGTFICNTDSDRRANNLETRTLSLWNLFNINSKRFINLLYSKIKKDILYPSSSVRDLTIWSNLYLRDIRYTPMGSSEHVSKPIPARIRSYEDLSKLTTNTLHRSTSDPSLSDSLPIESTSITTCLNNNPLLFPPQSPFNRSQNSTSTNSLFGQPHHLGTLNDSHPNVINNSNTNQISIPINISPDNRIKQHSFTTDDSSPDLTQLALSYQRYSLNPHSVDNLLRAMSRPRKYTNSTSSTTSSLSDAWSLTKINSYDPHQTQKMMQHMTSNKIIKSIRKRIDTDGLTKVSDKVTSKMLEKERTYQQRAENLREHKRQMQRFVYTLININHNQNASPRMDVISESNINTIETFSCSSWQKIDNTDASITRWTPDFNAQTCHSCMAKFQQWPISRKHHCRICGNVFCNACADYYKLIPALNLKEPVRVCCDCFPAIDDSNNNNNINNGNSEPARTAAPIPIQSGCRQSNGSFNSPGGQKVKG
ncbi:unnamed protein product [Rotaria socialis]|uniref:phosphatidylinositol-3,5-bisphosphate 3-phosphatase n=1 Tax=Rotaria socialis TaxID=392032 RepID=A0A818L2H7_9BILA|nr:unnamed protein product [Rotaria socialis]CAF4548320.1 unnamed protein product [Rotaria socialis]